MDYVSFFIVVVTILAAVIAVLSVHHVYRIRENKQISELRSAENANDWDRCEKAMNKFAKKFPKMMKDFIKTIEESL